MRPGQEGRGILVKRFFNLGGDFQRERVQSLPEIANILQKLIVENDGRDRRGEAGGGGHQGFRDAGSYRSKACSAGAASLRAVAPGIAEALVTTAAGLAAAIPAVIFYNQFLQNIRDLGQRLDTFALEVSAQIEKTFN